MTFYLFELFFSHVYKSLMLLGKRIFKIVRLNVLFDKGTEIRIKIFIAARQLFSWIERNFNFPWFTKDSKLYFIFANQDSILRDYFLFLNSFWQTSNCLLMFNWWFNWNFGGIIVNNKANFVEINVSKLFISSINLTIFNGNKSFKKYSSSFCRLEIL